MPALDLGVFAQVYLPTPVLWCGVFVRLCDSVLLVIAWCGACGGVSRVFIVCVFIVCLSCVCLYCVCLPCVCLSCVCLSYVFCVFRCGGSAYSYVLN